MVDVAMGIEQLGDLQVLIEYKGFQFSFFLRSIASRINECGRSLIVVEEVTVLLKWVEGEALDVEHAKSKRD
jgi:hypothetical protein